AGPMPWGANTSASVHLVISITYVFAFVFEPARHRLNHPKKSDFSCCAKACACGLRQGNPRLMLARAETSIGG
ncbi:hypothetical protein, partial [Bradyrhizobium sp. 144]|uniref:hypothetical protein n=1 Tax=Bradyrhizobium sp. 144 TaxID=2782620 RepID=UPI001FF74C05